MKLSVEKQEWFNKWIPQTGCHQERQTRNLREACIMEAVAFMAGEPHSDHPVCACPVIAAFCRSGNDSSESLRLALKPYTLKLIGTKSTARVEKIRSYMAIDWYIRTFTATWLELGNHHEHADKIRKLKPIKNLKSLKAAQSILSAAESAAESAAKSAKHTPGPWNVVGSPTYGSPYAYLSIVADLKNIAGVGADYVTEDGDEVCSKEAKANARLIAAAPELLEALDGLIGHCLNVPGSGTGEFHRALGRARRAIAKAEAPPVTPDDPR